MSRPRVSICVPLHHPDRRHLAELVASVVAQDYQPMELVLVDDCSGFDPGAFMGAGPHPFDLVRARNETNLGMVGNWNAAVTRSTGALAMVVGQDDCLGRAMIGAYVHQFERHPEVVLCSANEVFVDEMGEPARRREPVNRRERIYRHRARYLLDQADIARLSLRNGQGFGEPSAVMFRRSVFDAIGGYRAEFEHAADVDFNIRAAEHGPAVYLGDAFLRRRIHAASLTASHIACGANGRDRHRLYRAWADHAGLTAQDRARIRVAMSTHALYDAARFGRARRWRQGAAAAWSATALGGAPPRYYLERARELISGRNLDER